MNPYEPPSEPRKTTQHQPSRPSFFREALDYPVVLVLFAMLFVGGCVTLTVLFIDLLSSYEPLSV